MTIGAIGTAASGTKSAFMANPEFLFLIPIAIFACYLVLKFSKKLFDKFRN